MTREDGYLCRFSCNLDARVCFPKIIGKFAIRAGKFLILVNYSESRSNEYSVFFSAKNIGIILDDDKKRFFALNKYT